MKPGNPVAQALVIAAALLQLAAALCSSREEELAHLRNLGKAFYENPTTHAEAVEIFKKALGLSPESPRERVNYGLALLRAGKTKEGVEQLERAQQQDPSIPHTWFNLGIAFKKDSRYERALAQFEQMVRLAPDEPVSHYNLGYLYKVTGKSELALQHYEIAARLDPALAGPHFQLYNAYRSAGRATDATRELRLFQEIKKRQAGSALPEDLDWSYYAEVYDVADSCRGELVAPPGQLKFEDVQVGGGFDPSTAGLAVLDADGDGQPDLVVWSRNGVQLLKKGSLPVNDSGLGELKGVVFVSPADFNNDGLPDLCVITESEALLYVNRQGTFSKHAAALPAGRYKRAVWLDYDHDYDLDLFLLGEKSVLLRNNGSAGFSDETAGFPFVAGQALDGTSFDLLANTNLSTDLIVTYADRSGVIYRDKLAGNYQPEAVEALQPGTKFMTPYDVNQDGWTDLAAATPSKVLLLLNRDGKLQEAPGPESAQGPIAFCDFDNRGIRDLVVGGAVYRNQDRGRFVAAKDVGLSRAVALAEADFDGDAKSDLAGLSADGRMHLLKNKTPTSNSWLRIGLAGVKNLKLAPGARVEIKAGCLYEKAIYRGVPLLFGLQSHREADTVRITWPNGLVQNEMKQPAGRFQSYKEAQRLSGSCPMIFTWNGKNFEFITDVLGVAPLGASSGDGHFFPVNHREHVQIPAESFASMNGRYEVRITEELREVSYLDAVRLIAVDHPSETEIFTNEKFKSPPFPGFRLYGVQQRVYPLSARDSRGDDVRGRLLRLDRTYPDAFRRDYNGVAEMHWLDLDFGSASSYKRAVLILNGWVDWADGSIFRAAAQEGRAGLVMPYLQVKDKAGHWQTVVEDMGMPAGKPKTIAVDLSGKFLSASREIRIVTNFCLYWDEIFLSEDTKPAQVDMTTVEATSAELRFRGFSTATIHPERKQPETFDYERWMPVSIGNPTPGYYTRYGDVRPLLAAADNRLVIMGSGDELRLSFPATGFPALRRGWKRDFLLRVDGWAKDQDANTAYSQTVEPLPFRSMSAYPYPSSEHFPDDASHRSYRAQYNTRPALRLIRPLSGEGGNGGR